MENGILWDGALLVDEGKICAIGSAEKLTAPAGAKSVDAQGCYIGPGFVDIHCHGCDGTKFEWDPEATARHFLRHGETTVLASLYYDLTLPQMLDAIARIRDTMAHTDMSRVIRGIYIEGPYMNPQYGAMPEKYSWGKTIDMQQARQLVEQAGEDIRVWSVAPEREGIEAFVALAKQSNPSVRFAYGHTQATPEQVYRLKKYGLCIQTHSTNATGTPNTVAGTRSCGPNEACLYDTDIYAEVICDSCGIHVHPDMLRLIRRIKGEERMILITDSTIAYDQPPESLAHIKDLNFDRDGNLNGSRLTLDVASHNMMTHTPAGLCEVFRMSSLNPARAVGLDGEVGSIEVGKRANLVFTDDRIRLKNVMLDGQFISKDTN